MHLSHLHLQYDRLVRHRGQALEAKDEISFLDLAHSLRVWVDMKVVVTTMARDRGVGLRFRHYVQPKSNKKELKGAVHWFMPLASGVDSPEVKIRGLRSIRRALTPEDLVLRSKMGPPNAIPSRMTFIEWLAAGVLVVPSDDPKHPHIPLSRETIVNRVANLLGASHPEGGNDQELQEKKFDRHILELHKINVAEGFPATYYQLLEIAEDILLAFRPLRLATI
jgi:hypothetical protein